MLYNNRNNTFPGLAIDDIIAVPAAAAAVGVDFFVLRSLLTKRMVKLINRSYMLQANQWSGTKLLTAVLP